MRDVTLEDTFYVLFTTRQFSDGVPTTLSGTPVVSAYEDNSATQITSGITLGVDHDSVTGLNLLTIAATAANGFESGKSYALVITTGTVGGTSVVGEVVGEFTIESSAAAVDLANATDGLGAIKTETAAIVADTNELQTDDVPGLISALDTVVDRVETDTQDIQSRLPAALVGGRMDANVGAVSGDATAADNLEADYDGTGYNKSNSTIGTTTTNTDMRGTDNAALASVLGALADAASAGDPTASDTVIQYLKQIVNTLEGTAGIPTFPAEAAPANAVSMVEVLRAIHADVTGLNGDAMRGTDSAALASVATEARLAELDAANIPADLDAALADTNELQGDWVNGGRLDLLIDAIKAVTDNLPDSGALNDLNTILTRLGTPSNFGSGTSTIAANLEDMADDGTNTYDRSTDSLQAIRDRGDAAWITGGGGSITQSLNVQPVLPLSIDLANTATVRLGLLLLNALDDLPSTAEITPGTISIERKAIGGTSWTAVVTNAAMSEQAGMVYYDEVFDSATGYAEGDSIRVTFKSVSITADSNTHEVCDANGIIFQTEIRQTMRGTDSAYTGTPPTAAAIRSEMDSNSTQLAAIVADTNELQTDDVPGLIAALDAVVDTVKAETALIVADTNELQTDDVPGLIAALDAVVDTVKAETALIVADTNELQTDDIPGLIAALNDPTAAAVAAAVWNALQASHVTAGTFGELATEIASILADTNELQSDDIPGTLTTIEGKVDTIDGNVDAILVDTADMQPKLGTPAADLAADIAAVKAETAAIVLDTNELQTDDVPGLIAALNDLSAAQVNAEVVDVMRTDTIPDSYAADGAQPTIAQALLAIQQFLQERTVSGTTVTVKKPDGTTTAMTFTLNDATNPAEITRAT